MPDNVSVVSSPLIVKCRMLLDTVSVPVPFIIIFLAPLTAMALPVILIVLLTVIVIGVFAGAARIAA